jgi:hypothetical protein
MMSLIRLGSAILLAAALGAAASCATGTDPSTTPEEDDDASAASSSSAGSGGGDGGGSGSATGSGTGGGGGGGAGSGGGGGAGAGGSPPESALVASLYTMAMTMDCQPGGTPSITGSFEAYYDNMAGSFSSIAIVKSAKLTLTFAADSYVWSFPVAPQNSFVAAGATTLVTHTAGAGSGAGDGALCDYCGQQWKLDVEWDLGGKPGSDSIGPGSVVCAQ